MKSVLISIKPKYVELIANGQKNIEVRKTRPKIDTPFKCYIYCTKDKQRAFFTEQVFDGEKGKWAIPHLGNGKVIGEFVCDWITEINPHCDIDGCVNQYIHGYPAILGDDCLLFNEMKAYLGNKKGYDWHISDLVIYEQPKEVSEFFTPMGKRPSYMLERPFQSWGYVEEKE